MFNKHLLLPTDHWCFS